MAITRACIDQFRSNLPHSVSTWQPIRWFKVKGSKVKVTAYLTANTDSRQNVSRFLTYLARERVENYTWWDWWAWLHVAIARWNFAKRPKTIFLNQSNPKNPERLARCRSAFEMQCFRNCTLSSFFFLSYSNRYSCRFAPICSCIDNL